MKNSTSHDSAVTHVTGRSQFIDDRSSQKGELQIALVCSPHASAEILSIDFRESLTLDGFVQCLTAKDLHHNRWGTIIEDQVLLADSHVSYSGEPIVLIVAESLELLRKAKALVKIKYKILPAILSIAEARKQNSFIGAKRSIQRGDCSQNSQSQSLKGTLKMSGQEHFYLETQASYATPLEGKGILVESSSQHPTEVQHVVAHALGLKFSEVTCVVKRMGGAFGGKESQACPFAVYAALVAHKFQRPARMVLNRDDDMIITGKRNPFEIEYTVQFNKLGKIHSLKAELFSDSGAYADLSTSIMERAMLHVDNAYYLENVEIHGTVCRTHHAPTTAFRGFGGPKGVALIEGILEKIAQTCGRDAVDVRKENVYLKNQLTPYGQKIDDDVLGKLFSDAEERFVYRKRRDDCEKFNQSNTRYLKGLSMTAVKFGISFTTRFLNQGSALVNLHLDGTLQVSTGATEMGQGVNTKIAQIVASVFCIDPSEVQMQATSTEKNHNTSPTAASSGTDINGAAARNAAVMIRNRLAAVAVEYFKRPPEMRGKMASVLGKNAEINIDSSPETVELLHPEICFDQGKISHKDNPSLQIPWQKIIEEAYFHRVSLGAYGFFKYPGIHFNKETGSGHPFFYFTNGVALSEVKIDRDTGEYRVEKVQILMDLGRPINPDLDLGQIHGAFVQGMGWVSTEKLSYSSNGALLTHAPSTYKIPSIQDIPKTFEVYFFENSLNHRNVLSSKAVGEPPLLLALSVWCACENALSYTRKSHKLLPIPATYETIFLEIFESSDLKELLHATKV